MNIEMLYDIILFLSVATGSILGTEYAIAAWSKPKQFRGYKSKKPLDKTLNL